MSIETHRSDEIRRAERNARALLILFAASLAALIAAFAIWRSPAPLPMLCPILYLLWVRHLWKRRAAQLSEEGRR